jgi:drug/metabolite transporter (DMT)-like permease
MSSRDALDLLVLAALWGASFLFMRIGAPELGPVPLMALRGRASFRPGGDGLAVVAALGATLSYGVAASYAKRRLTGVNPLAVAGGSQLAATAALAPFASALWPAAPVSTGAWAAVATLGVACTAVAYVLYFRLIARVGPARAIGVTFLVPPFAMVWGALFLGEGITLRMLAGCAVILLGTALATGLLRPRREGRAIAAAP